MLQSVSLSVLEPPAARLDRRGLPAPPPLYHKFSVIAFSKRSRSIALQHTVATPQFAPWALPIHYRSRVSMAPV